MVVDHTYRLQEGIDDDCAHEVHPPTLQVHRDAVRQLGAGPNLIVRVQDNLPIGEAPEVAVKGAELFLDIQKRLRVLDGRLDFAAVPHNPRVRHQSLQLLRAVPGDGHRIESVEGPPERLPLL